MKIRVHSFVDDHKGEPPVLDVDDTDNRLNVTLEHDGEQYRLQVDRHGRLQLQALGMRALVVRPLASNLIHVHSDR